jgi:subtilase family serine protease
MIWHARRWRWSLAVVAAVSLSVVPITSALASEPRVVVASGAPLPARAVIVPARIVTSFDVALRGADPVGLRSLLAGLYDPASPDFHHFLSTAQFARRFGASRATVSALRSYFAGFGLRVGPLSRGGVILHVRGRTTQIARAFDARVVTVHQPDTALAAQFVTRATLPAELAHDVTAVAGLSSVVASHAQLRRAHTAATVPGVCPAAGSDTTTTPNSLGGYTLQQQGTLYGMASAWANGVTGTGTTIGVYELGPYNPSDVTTYLSCYGLHTAITSTPVDGGATGGFSNEATMDVEEAAGLAPGATIDVYAGPNSGTGPTDIYQQIADANTAAIVTTSWGTCESDPNGDAVAEQPIFEQMAAQGQTVIAAAGDSGSSDCAGITNNNLAVDDPASQPFVTGVGGLSVTSISPLTQTVWNDGPGSGGGAGGGGQSILWSRPSWQNAPGITSADTMRMVPDLSVMADPNTGFIEYFSGSHGCTTNCTASWGSIGGTSIGSPLVGAMVALAAQSCGQGRLGFLNPTLYQMATTGFIDVTSGNNDLYGAGGYSAGPGYDMASGLGSPNPTTFMSELCPQPFTATGSTFTLSNPHPLTSGTAQLTMSLRNVSQAPLANGALVITASASHGVATIDGDPTSAVGGGQATYAITTDANGAATVTVSASQPGPVDLTVSYESRVIYTTTLEVRAAPATRPQPPTVTVTALVGALRMTLRPAVGSDAPRAYQYSLNGGRTWSSTPATRVTLTIGGLGRGRTYAVVVRAVAIAGPGPSSPVRRVTTRA